MMGEGRGRMCWNSEWFLEGDKRQDFPGPICEWPPVEDYAKLYPVYHR